MLTRFYFLAGATALFLLMTLPGSASAALWPGFPFTVLPDGLSASITKPRPIPVTLCSRTMHVAGITLTVPRPCRATPPPPPAIPTLTFTATPATIIVGESSTLAWDSTDATSCTASDGWTGAKTVDGSEPVTPAVTTQYTLTCSNGATSVIKSATVTVNPAPVAPTLTLVKTVVKNNGGTAAAADFQAKIDGGNVPWGSPQTVTVGSHTASETTLLTGYTPSLWGTDCAANGTITLAAGENKTCTITNDDEPGTLIVKKLVIRDNGGDAATTTFSFQVGGGTIMFFDADDQIEVSVNAGTHTVTEVPKDGYTTSYSSDCIGVVITNGETKTCTITNNDIAPATPTVDLSANPTTVNEGSTGNATSTLTWDSNNTNSCTALNGWSGSRPVDGTEIVQPTGTTSITYVLECTGPGGTVSDSVTLTVVPPAPPAQPLLSFSANPTTVHEGSLFDATTTLTWDSTNADSCVASNVTGWTGAKAADGSEVVTPTATSAYQLDCTGPGGSVQATTTVTFVPAQAVANHVVISEVFYDVDPDHGVESPPSDANEWVELYNPTASSVDLSFWTIIDSSVSFDMLPSGTSIAAGGYLVIVGTSTTPGEWSIPGGVPVVNVDSAVGSGLANAGDAMFLRDSATTTIDAMSWGDVTVPFTLGGVAEGHSLARTPVTTDTDTAADWADSATPDPGL